MSETKLPALSETLGYFDRQARLKRLYLELCKLIIEEAFFHPPDEIFRVPPDSPIANKTREVEAALGRNVDLEAHERDLERQSGCGEV